MRVLHVIPSLSPKDGGPSFAAKTMAEALAGEGVEVTIATTGEARVVRKNTVPYVVRPLGVLNQWGMRNRRRLPKVISFRFVELPVLINSAAIHYTSEAERKEAALLDARLAEHESAVIPLPVAM